MKRWRWPLEAGGQRRSSGSRYSRGGAGDQRREALAPLPASPFPAIGPIDLPLAGRSDGPLAPGFRVWCGRPGATPGITRGSPVHSVRCPNARNARRFLAGFDTCQIRQRLSAPWQALSCAPARPALPNFQPIVLPHPPFPYGLRLREIGPVNLPLADCSDGPLAPDFHGWSGRPEATVTRSHQPGPFSLFPQSLPRRYASCRI